MAACIGRNIGQLYKRCRY